MLLAGTRRSACRRRAPRRAASCARPSVAWRTSASSTSEIGELLAAAQPRDELESRRRARRAARLRQGAARPRRARRRDRAAVVGRAHGLAAGAREQRLRGASRPHLERNVELRRRYSACFPEAEHPYDPLLDDYEPGMSTAELRDALERLRDGLVPLVAAAPEIDDSLLRRGSVPRGRPARRWSRTVLQAVGVDDEPGASTRRRIPFAGDDRPGDVRLTTRYDEGDFDSLYSSLHEFGHGLYEHQIDPRAGPHAARPAASRARGTSRRAGCGRTWSAARRASGAGASPHVAGGPPRALRGARRGRRSSGPPTRCARASSA